MKVNERINIIIADDHPVFRQGLAAVISEQKNIRIAGTAANGQEVLDLFKTGPVDICLLDINMPIMDGVSTAEWIISHSPTTKIIVVTTYDEEKIISELLFLGVSGYLLKTASKNQILECIDRVAEGKLYFSDDVHKVINSTSSYQPDTDQSRVILTPRELQIVQLLAREYSNEMIAEELRISYRTVETHRKNIMHKTNAKNLAGLVRFAYQHNLLFK